MCCRPAQGRPQQAERMCRTCPGATPCSAPLPGRQSAPAATRCAVACPNGPCSWPSSTPSSRPAHPQVQAGCGTSVCSLLPPAGSCGRLWQPALADSPQPWERQQPARSQQRCWGSHGSRPAGGGSTPTHPTAGRRPSSALGSHRGRSTAARAASGGTWHSTGACSRRQHQLAKFGAAQRAGGATLQHLSVPHRPTAAHARWCLCLCAHHCTNTSSCCRGGQALRWLCQAARLACMSGEGLLCAGTERDKPACLPGLGPCLRPSRARQRQLAAGTRCSRRSEVGLLLSSQDLAACKVHSHRHGQPPADRQHRSKDATQPGGAG